MTNDRYNEILNSSEFQNELKPKLDLLRDLLMNGRASVMVGAGFSKNAQMEEGVDVKDWNGLAQIFFKIAYGYEPSDKDLKLREPIELASRVTSLHGHDFMDSLLEKILPDEKITPGKLHKELVKLPWADIYTTNYDSLLERADASKAYNYIRGERDILQKNGARIIKLHGSFPDVKPYVIDQNDYRNYSETHPLLTAVIHNTLITNKLYLIGFSGDDPNFLNWISWLRNNSNGVDVPPVYLFDALGEQVTEADLQYKKSCGIEIIQRPAGFYGISEYFEFIFRYLKEEQVDSNEEWNISISYEQLRKVRNFKFSEKGFSNNINESELTKLIEAYRDIRETYPGWAFLRLSQFENCFEHLFDYEISEVEQLINRIPEESLLDLVYEFEWRLRKAFYPISLLPWFVTKCEKIINEREESDFYDNAKLQSIAIALLSHYRITFDVEAFEILSKKLESLSSSDSGELITRFRYEIALQAVSRMDYDKALIILNQWDLKDDNYVGILWKSAILIEINREEEAYNLLIQGIKHLINTENPNVKQSYLGAFISVINVFSPYKESYVINENIESSFEVHSYFRFLKVRLYDCLHKKQNREESRSHGFNLQDVNIIRYVNGISISSQVRYASRIHMVWEQFGYPYRLGAMTINSQLIQLSCDVLLQSNVPQMALNYLTRAAQTDSTRNVIKKESIVCLDRDVVNNWVDMVLDKADSVDDWSQSSALTYRLSSIILIILSRMSVILDNERIKRLIPYLFKVYTYQNRIYQNEYLITAFNCLPKSEQGFVVQLAAKCPIIIENANRDIWIPQNVDKNEVTLSDDALDIVLDSLKEADIRISNIAYIRATYIYNYCNDDQKAKLDKAIIIWRNANILNEVNATFSFNLVKGSDDTNVIIDRLNKSIIGLREKAQSKKDNDGIIRFSGRSEEELATIRALYAFITNEQLEELYPILAEYMLDVVSSFEKETSSLSQTFGPSKLPDVDVIAKIIFRCNSKQISPKILDSLCDSFTKIYHFGYPRYDAIEALNYQSPILEENNLFNDILSLNNDIRKPALNYLSRKGFSYYSILWNTIWNKVTFSLTPEVVDYIEALINASEYSKMVLPNSNTLLTLFRNKASEIEASYLCDGDKFDIIYRIKLLAGYISNFENLPIEALQAISAWQTGADMDNKLPKDVTLGFEEGIALYQRCQAEQNNC